jgi:CheY-like chemotaxis protein
MWERIIPMAKIMIVDDDSNIRLIARRMLEGEGHMVVEASGGIECLNKLSEEQVDLVFLDIRMPGIDGWQTLRTIKKFHENLPVAMLTVKPLMREIVEREEIGDIVDYVSKPFSKEDLIEVIRQLNRLETPIIGS